MLKRNQPIYFDHAATTALDIDVLKAMLPYMTQNYGNASSIHQLGRQAAMALDKARVTVAQCLNCETDEIIFTSGGTESDNTVIHTFDNEDFYEADRQILRRIMCSAVEHPAIIHATESMYDATRSLIQPNNLGIITPDNLDSCIAHTVDDVEIKLISIMTVNNELGSVNNIPQLAAIAHKYNAYFHTDAVQAVGSVNLDVEALGVDYLSLSAHKFGGPKGVGILYVRRGVPITSFLKGGGQENRLRASTYNIPGIVGAAEALKLAVGRNYQPTRSLKNDFIMKLQDLGAKINGSLDDNTSSSGIISATFPGVDAQSLLFQLDMHNVCVSAGSACSSSQVKPSYVLKAIGLSDEDALSTIRFSLGPDNYSEEVDYTIGVLKQVLPVLRGDS